MAHNWDRLPDPEKIRLLINVTEQQRGEIYRLKQTLQGLINMLTESLILPESNAESLLAQFLHPEERV